MRIGQIYRIAASRLALLIFATGLAQGAPGGTLVDPTFAVLKTRTGTYTNVTVTTRAQTYIYIVHSGGMTSVKVADLPAEVRQELAYDPPEAPKPQKTNDLTTVAARELNGVGQNLKPFENQLKQRWPLNRPALRVNKEVLCTLLGIALLMHLGFSYCCRLICLKAKSPDSFLVWLPVLQVFPMLRAAGMSGWWFLALFVPLLNIVGAVLWSLKIVNARGKHVIWAILLILPGLSLLAFLYLAFSSDGSSEGPPPKTSSKFQTRGLQSAEAAP